MIFGRLDWTSWGVSKGRALTFGIGMVALVGSFVVLGATVLRVQNLRTTVERPKAAGIAFDPNCSKEPSSCSRAATDPWSVPYGERTWCHPNHCPKSWNPNDPNGKPYCGLFYINNCMSKGYCGDNSECPWYSPDCDQNTHTCGVNQGGNPCWNPQPIPQNGYYDPDTNAFKWRWDTQFSSTVNSVMAYAWTSPSRSGDAYAAAQVTASGLNSVKLTDFSPALVPNTTYYVLVNPNSYSSPAADRQCMNTATQGWSFTTPAAAVTCPTGQTACSGVCKNLRTDPANCGACGTACSAGQNCVAGACTTVATHLSCVNSSCVSVTGAGNNTDGCTEVGGSCGSSSCTTTDVCKTAAVVNNVCTVTNKADSTACTTTAITDGTCQAGVCTTKANEANACWGNLGANGRCYDCNGDGVINVLDFSCFRVAFGKSAQ